MSYFASRTYPLGPVRPELVTAMFFTFSGSMVRESLPEAWRLVSVDDVAQARLDAVDAALRRMLGDAIDSATVAEAADLAAEALAACDLTGRPLFAAHAAMPWPNAPHLRLWHAASLVHEHRGDGHIAACLASGLDGLAAHVTHVASGAVPREMGQRARGWNDDEWAACELRLERRGLMIDGRLTDDGRALRAGVERTTDDLAAEPWDRLGKERTDKLAALAGPIAQVLVDAGAMPLPNPIGVQWPPKQD
jgi:hypothetical protein